MATPDALNTQTEGVEALDTQTEGVATHYDAVAADYHLQYRRQQLDAGAEYPANYFRLQMLVNRLASLGARRVYEVGVGEGTPLLTIAGMGIEVAGCDISEAMVEQAKMRVEQAGLPPSTVAWGDIQDSTTFAHQLNQGPFDAVVAAGVLPHVANDSLFLQNVSMLLRPGGAALIEFRNKLFSLFSFNSKTKEFIVEDLLRDVDPEVTREVAKDLEGRLAMDQPQARSTIGERASKDAAPGYDAILSKFHNPFELVDTFQRNGFVDARIHWYHYHPAPPMLESTLGDAFRRAAFALEHDPSDWRGYFLCSAGVVEATNNT
jgi:2-polyprenyl-3-methyl-5-hydroxy-6-metoxy-1,4-benzoquinol methylase